MNTTLLLFIIAAASGGLIESLITLLVVALVAYVIWYLASVFIKDATALKIIGIILGLCVLLYGLKLFGVLTP